MNRIIELISISAGILFILSCSSGKGSGVFSMVRPGTFIKPGSIAVVAGTNEDQDYLLATKITENLQKETDFKVMPQEEIAEKIPGYPYKNLIEKWKGIRPEKEFKTGIVPGNIEAVNSLYKYLNTEYIYIVWSPRLSIRPSNPTCATAACIVIVPIAVLGGGSAMSGNFGDTNVTTMYVYGRLLSYPAGEVIGYTNNAFLEQSCFFPMIFRSYNTEITNLISDTGREIALEIKEFIKK